MMVHAKIVHSNVKNVMKMANAPNVKETEKTHQSVNAQQEPLKLYKKTVKNVMKNAKIVKTTHHNVLIALETENNHHQNVHVKMVFTM